MKICNEMRKLRETLTAKGIAWEDKSVITPTDKIEKMKRRLSGVPETYLDTSIFRTRFSYKGKKWSVINGYGTYGGYDPFTGKNDGLLELMVDENDPVGWMTAEQINKLIKGA